MKPEDLYIVKESPFLIQKKCQDHARGLFLMFFIGMVLYYIVSDLVPEILGVFFPKGYIGVLMAINDIPEGTIDTSKIADSPIIIMLYAFAFNGIFQTGKALYALTFIRNRKVEYMALTEGLMLGFKAIMLSIVQSFFITIWTFFFIIPGIVVAYNFRQAFYILADDPSKSVLDILRESKIRMLGNRLNLLKLDISYLSLIALGYMPVILFDYMSPWTDNLIVDAVAGFVFALPLYYAFSIMLLGRTAFYELLLQHGFDNFKYAGQDAFRGKPQTIENE